MRVELRAEFVLQEADVVAGALDRIERVSAGDPGASRPNRVRFFQDVFVSRDAFFVREHDVVVHFFVGDRTVETVEGADARDEEDHLRAVRALAAADRKRTAGESAVGSHLKAHASTKGRCGIKIPHRWTPVARQTDAVDVGLFPRGPTVVSLVVPEVEITPSVELTDPGPASDFHFHTSK